MGIIAKIKGWISMILKRKVTEEFNVEQVTSSEMDKFINMCSSIYAGNPYWLDDDKHIKTINFAKSICSETARLATLAIGIKIDGSARATWLQQQIDKIYFNLRHWVEYGCAYGTIILKPNGSGIDVITPDRFIVVEECNGEITGIVFLNQEASKDKKKYYNRLEYHRFVDGQYVISNKCYIGDTPTDSGKPISIEKTPWADLLPEAVIGNIDKPLYGVLRTPSANNIDISSPLGMPAFADAIEELKDLDIAYSRNSKEVYDSNRTVLLDSDRLLPSSGQKLSNMSEATLSKQREQLDLPDYIRNVCGDGVNEFYKEINPSLSTETRLKGINSLLSQIGYKCGFSNGYFVFNESTGITTATQVEADQQRTIQFIKDVRDKLEECMDSLIYALNAFADLYELAPLGKYEVTYDFGDITYNREEDRARWNGYVTAGKIPFWYFLMKFEGFSEEDAKALEKAAQINEPKMFGEEE